MAEHVKGTSKTRDSPISSSAGSSHGGGPSLWSPAALLRLYLMYARRRPILTKSLTSGLVSALGPALQHFLLARRKSALPLRKILAFGVYGAFVTGPVTHTFYLLLERSVPAGAWSWLKKLFIERVCFTPPFLFFFLLGINILQGMPPRRAFRLVREAFWPTLLTNYKVWTPAQLVNLTLVPLPLRVMFASLVALGWNAYLAARNV